MPDSVHFCHKHIDRLTLTYDNERSLLEGYPSGQRGQTVNLLAYAFGGSNPPPSTMDTLPRSTG